MQDFRCATHTDTSRAAKARLSGQVSSDVFTFKRKTIFQLAAKAAGRRLSKTAVALAATGLLLTGCSSLEAAGIYLEDAPATLPQLSAEQFAHQSIARHDQALADALDKWTTDSSASDCPACQDAVTRFADNCEARIQAVGGLWQPWPQGTPDNAQTLAPIPPVEPQVTELVRQGITSAVTDLRMAAQVDSATRPLVAAAAMGRVADSFALAAAAQIPQDDLDAWFEQASSLELPEQMALPSPSPAQPSTFELTPSPDAAVSRALRDWDCVQDLLPHWTGSYDAGAGPSAAKFYSRAQVDQLANSIGQALQAGATDTRVGTCASAFSAHLSDSEAGQTDSVTALQQLLAASNLELFTAAPELKLPQAPSSRGLSFPAEQLVLGVYYWQLIAGPDATPALIGLELPQQSQQ